MQISLTLPSRTSLRILVRPGRLSLRPDPLSVMVRSGLPWVFWRALSCDLVSLGSPLLDRA